MWSALRNDNMVLQGNGGSCLDGACSPIDFGRHGAMLVESGQASPECSAATTPRPLRMLVALFGTSRSACVCETVQFHTYT